MRGIVDRILRISRYLLVIAVIGSYIISAILIVYGAALLIHILIGIFTSQPQFGTNADRYLMLECIQLIDIFLLGTAFYIVALGLYELFIQRLPSTPGWLIIHDIEDLKAKLLGVIVVILSVFFLEQAINWNGSRDILDLGIGEALMIGAIVLTIAFHGQHTSARERRRNSLLRTSATGTNPGSPPTQESDQSNQ
jgi:uncharacterized protein (TIGR00645 family)